MLTIEECRALLGEGCCMSDDELADLRLQLYAIAELALTNEENEGPPE